MQLAISIYFLSTIVQIISALICLTLFYYSENKYKYPWIFLGIGLILLISRTINLIFPQIPTNTYDVIDAFLSLLISIFLIIGVISLRNIFDKYADKNEKITELLRLDTLTGSFSRSEILYCINDELNRSFRNKREFAILELDIDNFKKINDEYGHQVGDEILIISIKKIKEILRSFDSIGRIGGEEFLILLPETGIDGAIKIAERIRMHIENTLYKTSSVNDIHITISTGVTVFNANQEKNKDASSIIKNLIKQADMAMYQAKANGRNCVYVWEDTKEEN